MGIKDFFLALLSTNNALSSKSFVGIASFAILALTCLCNLFFKLTLADYMFYGLLGLITACYSLNTVAAVKSMGVKSDVASDIVKSEPKPETAQDAKDVLNSSKP